MAMCVMSFIPMMLKILMYVVHFLPYILKVEKDINEYRK